MNESQADKIIQLLEVIESNTNQTNILLSKIESNIENFPSSYYSLDDIHSILEQIKETIKS